MGRSARDRAERRRRSLRRFGLIAGLIAAAVAAGAAVVALLRAADASPKVQTVAAICVAFVALAIAVLLVFSDVSEPIGLLAAAIGIALSVVGGLSYLGVIEEEPPVGCLNSSGALKATAAAERTVVYAEATVLSDAKALVLPGCALSFTGYCIGAVHPDATQGSDTLDARWLILDDGQGLIASGDTVGTIAADRKPSECPRGRPAPQPPQVSAFELDMRTGMLRLTATARHAAYIGYAIEARAGWVRLGWDRTPEDGSGEAFRVPPDIDPGARVAAAACIGVQRSLAEAAIRAPESGRVPRPDRQSAVMQPSYRDAVRTACDAGIPQPNA